MKRTEYKAEKNGAVRCKKLSGPRSVLAVGPVK